MNSPHLMEPMATDLPSVVLDRVAAGLLAAKAPGHAHARQARLAGELDLAAGGRAHAGVGDHEVSLLQAQVHELRNIVDLRRVERAAHHDGLHVLGAHDAAEAVDARGVVVVALDDGVGHHVFAGRADDEHAVLVAEARPQAVLGGVGVHLVEVAGGHDLHVVVLDDQDRELRGLAHEHDAVPPGVLEFGAEMRASPKGVVARRTRARCAQGT